MKPERRRRLWRRLALGVAPFALAVLAGCTGGDGQVGAAPKPGKPAPVGGIGGTGLAQGPGGIGGTGLKDWGYIAENGIGGTGIAGIVTGHGSIWVNGLEVDIAPGTRIELDGRPVPAAELAIGTLVAVQAEGAAPRPTARAVAVAPALQGPVQQADRAAGRLTVLGQVVYVDAETRLPDGAFPAPGERVRVHGLTRADGSVSAAVIASATGMGARLSGILERLGEGWAVAGVPVRLAAGAAKPLEGRPVVVTGAWDGAAILAEGVQPDPVSALLERVAQVSLQGYLVLTPGGGAIRVGAATVRLSAAPAALEAAAGDGGLVVATGALSPEKVVILTSIRGMQRSIPAGPTPTSRAADQPASGGAGMEAPPLRPPFAGQGNPWGGPPAAPPRGPPPGVPGEPPRGPPGAPPGKGPPCGTPPCGGPPPGKGK